MLTRLTVSNYALIDELSVNFEPGFNIITGETGAGKSIVLGALSLILGARADISAIRNVTEKCVVEGTFQITGYGLEPFFTANDLDFDSITIIRREISPAGKSRSFVNDTPVNLQQLRELTLRLIDIHSQHQNLELNSQQFQLQLVDVVARSNDLLKEYRIHFEQFNNTASRLDVLLETASKARADLDYYEFQFAQLVEARLKTGEQLELEVERERLTHAEEIKSALLHVNDLLDGDHLPVLQQLRDAMSRLEKIKYFLSDAGDYAQRLESVYLELQDMARETGYLAENTEFNPQRLQENTDRLDLIYGLQQKHQVKSVEELIGLKQNLEQRINEIGNFDSEISQLRQEKSAFEQLLKEAAQKLTVKRKNAFPVIQQSVVEILRQLGIPHANFQITHQLKNTFSLNGADNIQILFSANKDSNPDEISRIASGGEISRVMLALKTLVSGSRMLPTIIFDEIDAGVSGEIALKMGKILKKLSEGMQVINITHLPQIAAKGDHHYEVYKFENVKGTFTAVRKLTETERVEELAKMVGGDNASETARKAAWELMNG